METKLYNIVAVVNEGFSDNVMEYAKDKGARGGTIISATGSVTSDSMKLYGLCVRPEKEIILIVVNEKLVEPILEVLYEKLGNSSEAQGIFFTLPVLYASDNLLKQYKKKTDTISKESQNN